MATDWSLEEDLLVLDFDHYDYLDTQKKIEIAKPPEDWLIDYVSQT
jgi:hypothetical protein